MAPFLQEEGSPGMSSMYQLFKTQTASSVSIQQCLCQANHKQITRRSVSSGRDWHEPLFVSDFQLQLWVKPWYVTQNCSMYMLLLACWLAFSNLLQKSNIKRTDLDLFLRFCVQIARIRGIILSQQHSCVRDKKQWIASVWWCADSCGMDVCVWIMSIDWCCVSLKCLCWSGFIFTSW